MSNQQDKQAYAQLEQVSDQLRRSLRSCHDLVEDYRHKLAANSNESEADSDEGGTTIP